MEQPNTDFAWTVVRSYLHDVYVKEVFTQLLKSDIKGLSGLSEKVLKEIEYNLQHAHDWMYRLGLGTEESHARLQQAVDRLYRFIPEIFNWDDLDKKFIGDTDNVAKNWKNEVSLVMAECNIAIPEVDEIAMKDYREGFHSEFLGHLIAEMQYLPRAYPDAKW